MYGSTAYGLNFRDGLLALLLSYTVGSVIIAFFATFGPETGMRQMVISRYAFGYYGTMILGFLVGFFELRLFSCG
jgi:purine-cytosine permease-like protein